MNAVQKIEAAIAKLEELQAKSTHGRWKSEHWAGDDCTLTAIHDRDGSLFIQSGNGHEADGELIVTLHRTIDAQLEVLSFGLLIAVGGSHPGNAFTGLADAILGGA